MSLTPPGSAPRRRSTAALAALSTILVVGAGLAVASPAPAAAPAQSAAAAAPVQKPNVRVTEVTATSTSTATGTDVATTLRLKNVTATRKSTRNTRLSLTNGDGTYRLGKAVVRPIRANGEITVRASHTVKLKVPAGQYAVRACRGPVADETCRTSAATVTVASAALVASPAALTFGDVKLGTAPARRDVTFTNSGKTPTGALTAAVTGSVFTLASSTCSSSLVPGASCTVSAVFTPSGRGAASGSLTLTGATAAATSVALSGNGLGAPVLTVDEDTLEFDDLLVGDTSAPVQFTVTNTGNIASGVPTVTLDPAPTEDFEITANTCTAALAPAATCSVSVTFSPTAAGERTAAVNVSATPGSVTTVLSGTGLAPAQLVLTPPSAAFGSELVGAETDPVTFTLTNSGDVASGVPSVALAGIDADQFTIVDNGCAAAVPADGTCTVDVAFAPTATGSASASLDASATPGGTDTSALTGTGETAPALAISEASYDYGFSSPPAEHTFTVTNTGTRTTGTPLVDVTGASAFEVTTDTCSAPLPGGGTCTVGVTYAGTGSTEQTAQLAVAVSPGNTVTADLTGFPVAFTVEPNSHDFGGVLVGESSDTQSFTLTNHRLTAALVVGETIIGPFSVDDSCFAVTIPAQGTCTFTAQFAPVSAGPKSGYVEYESSGASARVELSGEGLTPATLVVDQESVDFGTSAPGESGTRQVAVTNTGSRSATDLVLAVSGTDASDFSVTSTTCGTALAAGDSCAATLAFSPAVPGAKSAALTVTAVGTSSTVALTATSALRDVTFAPTTYDFGSQPVGSTTRYALRLVNNTGTPRSLSSIAYNSTFVWESATCYTLPANGSCLLTFSFTPTATGYQSTAVTVAGDGFNVSARLSGTGVPVAVRAASFEAVRHAAQPMSVRLRDGQVEVLDN